MPPNIWAGSLILLLSLTVLWAETPAARWESVGPPGGDRFLISIHPQDNRILYCVGHGGVHRSDDAAEHWRAIHSPQMQGSFLAFAFHPDDPDRIVTASTWSGAFESKDGGRSWRSMSAGLPQQRGPDGRRVLPLSSLVFGRDGSLYGSSSAGRASIAGTPVTFVYRYDEKAGAWSAFDAGLPADETKGPALLASGADGTLWLSTYGRGVFVLEGSRWEGRGPKDALATFIAPSPVRPQEAYLGTQADWVYRTKDGGANWTRLELPDTLSSGKLPLVYSMAIDPNNPDLVLIGCNSAGGSNEQPLFRPRPEQKAPAGTLLYLADQARYRPIIFGAGRYYSGFRSTIDGRSGVMETDGLRRSRVVYRTGGGLSCVMKMVGNRSEPKIDGLNGVYLNAMHISEDGTFLTAGEQGIVSLSSGAWHYRKPAKTLIYTWAFSRDYSREGAMFYATGEPAWSWPEAKGIYRLKLADMPALGDLRELRRQGGDAAAVLEQLYSGDGVWTLKTFASRPDILYAGTQSKGLLVSGDGGKTYAAHNDGLKELGVCAIAASADGALRFAGTRRNASGGGQKEPWTPVRDEPGDVYRYDAKGKRWEAGGIGKAVYAVAEKGGRVLACSSGGLSASNDGGRTWAPSSRGLPARGICADVKCGVRSSRCYAGIFGIGVFRSADAGRSWEDVSLDLTNKAIDELLIDPNDEIKVYAATLGSSAFRLTDE